MSRAALDRALRLKGRRVVFVAAWAVLGGAERNLFEVARHFSRVEGAEVEILSLTLEEGRFRDAVAQLEIPWHPIEAHWPRTRPSKAATLARVAYHLRRLQPDVVMPYCARPNVICGLVWRSTGASLCVWNQRDLFFPTKFGRRLVSRAARSCSLFVANSRSAGAFLADEVGAPRDRIRVIPDTVRLGEPRDDRVTWRERLGVSSDTVVVTMLAHLHKGKDHATLLRAWRGVLDRSENGAVLVLAGRASGTENALKALAYDLELGRGVRFLGDVVDVPGLLAASDVGVLSSRSESFPNALLECGAAGLPIAATDVPGIREVIGSHQYRFLAPAGETESLAEALLQLISNSELRDELGRENRCVALADPTDSASAAAEVVVDALAARRSRRTPSQRLLRS